MSDLQIDWTDDTHASEEWKFSGVVGYVSSAWTVTSESTQSTTDDN